MEVSLVCLFCPCELHYQDIPLNPQINVPRLILHSTGRVEFVASPGRQNKATAGDVATATDAIISSAASSAASASASAARSLFVLPNEDEIYSSPEELLRGVSLNGKSDSFRYFATLLEAFSILLARMPPGDASYPHSLTLQLAIYIIQPGHVVLRALFQSTGKHSPAGHRHEGAPTEGHPAHFHQTPGELSGTFL